MLDESLYSNRIKRVCEIMRDNDVDYLFLTPSPNFLYLTGLHAELRERLIALILNYKGDARIIAPSFEVSSHSKHTWIQEFIPWAEDENPIETLVNAIETKKDGLHFMFDYNLPLGIYWSLQKALGNFRETSSIASQLNAMRIVKSQEEIDCIKKAGKIIEKAVMKAFHEAKIGMTELELSQIVNSVITKEGSQPSFAIVQFGENSALPHASPGNRTLENGDFILMDCGCAVEGYNTDMTRVGVMGSPIEEQESVYSIVLQAQETAIENIQPGLSCGKVDGIARRIIEEAGYGEYFTHRLGHGIGIEVHEEPYVVRGNAMQLQSGMCHSIEPGIYLEGKFGIRIEDLVCVTDTGAEVLTYAPKDLIIIDSS
jgi:Xaa-Pro dipeptidase